MGHVVAIDAGTSGVRALVVDETGRVVDLAHRELPQHFPRPGWVEHDPLDIWHAVRDTLAEIGGRLTELKIPVAAIGITNQRETALAWDRRDGRPLHRAIVWQDRRTADRCAELRESGALSLVRTRTGLVLDPYFSATKWEWLLRNTLEPEVARAPWLALGTVDSWVLWNLSGGPTSGVFATDATNASRTSLFDTTALEWSGELCDLFGVPVDALPEVRPSAGRFGRVSSDVGAPFVGVRISGIAGDQQAALFGQACFEPGMVKVTYGTGSFVLANVGGVLPPLPDGLVSTIAWDLGEFAGTGAGASTGTGERGGAGEHWGAGEHGGAGRAVTYALEGSTFVAGAAIQWLRDGLGIIERADELGPLASSVPDSGGVNLVPAFTGLGSPWWDPDARGTMTGITRGTGRAQLARAVVEAIAFGVRDIVDAMTALTSRAPDLLRVDGGAAAMTLLLQLQADQLRATVARPRSVETTALGVACLAGLAEGVWSSLDELAGLWTLDAEFHLEVDSSVADAAYAGWLRSVDRSRGWAADPISPPREPRPAQ